MKPTAQQIEAYVRALKAIAETIKETPEGAPTGVMYAALMGRMSLETFNNMISRLASMGLIRVDGSHVAHWIGQSSVASSTAEGGLISVP